MLRLDKLATRFLVGLLLVGIGAVGASVLADRRASTHAQRDRRPLQELHQTVVDNTDGRALSLILDQIVEPPAVLGYVRGEVVGDGVAVALGQSLFTDFPLRVTGFFGPDNPGYRNGALVSLRVPGGVKDGITSVASDSPTVRRGMTVYVIAAAEGAFGYGGGDNLSRLVAVVAGQDVFEVRYGEVHGQGRRSSFHEPEARFQQHFARRP